MLNISGSEIIQASLETLYMVVLSGFAAVVIGLPIGILIFHDEALNKHPRRAKFLNFIINTSRSIPFIIFMVALIPFTRFLIGTAIGIHAAIVALALGASPLFARLSLQAFEQIPKAMIECGQALGASPWNILRLMLFRESLASLIDAITMTLITLISYSAMAGAIGGGGLGDLAIRYGYQRFDSQIMLITILILIIMVQFFQWAGIRLRQYIQHAE